MPFMANSEDVSVHVPSPIRGNKLCGKQKREELEREVSKLEKMLNNEEKVHEILESIRSRQEGSSLQIPNFLPPKIKELLAELAMVEGEIARLENQISKLQNNLDQEKEFTKEVRSKQATQIAAGEFPKSPMIVPNKGFPERMAFEAKALHFISKAIKGDYNVRDFSNPRRSIDLRDSFINSEEIRSPDKSARKSTTGFQKSSSPLRQPRHPSPKHREHVRETSSDIPAKTLPNIILSDDNNQKWQPHKLSESIMKCLIFIFVRLIRTSRAMELEKLGPISRFTQSSLSRSFRVDTAVNPNSSLLLQKDSKQQDPYGIFNFENSIPRDIGPYKNLVRFTSSSLDPKCISSSSSIPLLRNLRVLMTDLQKVDLRNLTYQQKLAFWINMFNACIMHGFLQYGVPSTPEKLFTLMNKATLNIGGNTINAQAIEHFILRKPVTSIRKEAFKKSEKDDKEAIVRGIYGLESFDPNVTFALCFGTRSSPAVKIYTAENVVAELEKSKLEYLQASIVITSSKKIGIPELLLRNMLDFAPEKDLLVEWICHQLPASGSLRKSIVDCFKGLNSGKLSPNIEKIPHDFEFQYLLAI